MLEVFCVELLSYWSVWFITGCASVNTVQEDRRGDYLEMVLLIGVCLRRGLHVAQHTGGEVPERCCTKRQQASTSWDCVFMTSCLFVHSDVSGLKRSFWLPEGKCGVKKRRSEVTTSWRELINLIGSKSFNWKSFFIITCAFLPVYVCAGGLRRLLVLAVSGLELDLGHFKCTVCNSCR